MTIESSDYICCLPGCSNRQPAPLNWAPFVVDEEGIVVFHCDACGERIWAERTYARVRKDER